MIHFLEFIVLFSGVGNMIISWTLFREIHWQDVVIIIIASIYGILPNQKVKSILFYRLDLGHVVSDHLESRRR
jgi:hypothetical protein